MTMFEQFIELKKPKLKEIVDEFPFRMRDLDGEETRHGKA
jgi:hypothetical protein